MGDGLEPDDERLVSLSKDGSLDAFNSLVERHQAAVYTLCLRLLGHPQSAEDAAQEAFLSAYRAISRFQGGNVRSWLLRIAANESKDELRRRNRKDTAGSLTQIFDNQELPIEVRDPAEPIEQRIERQELGAQIQIALLALPFDQRQAVVLSDLYGYHYSEIVEITGSTPGTVKSRIHRGRERLAKILAAHPELSDRPRRSKE
ncbi:MAG: sigma-70 family RNA polymerase sigma factor [Tepidiformaceae bacterium]